MTMMNELLRTSPLLALPLVALGLFLGVFLAVVARTFARGADAYDAPAGLPLGEEAPRER